MATFSADHADAILNADYVNGTPHVLLHTGDPGADGTANVAQYDDGGGNAPIVLKEASFAAPSNHPTNTERRVLSDADIEWSGSEINAGQEITHFTIWDGSDGPGTDTVLNIASVETPKTTGSDGVVIASGDLEVAITVHAKPE